MKNKNNLLLAMTFAVCAFTAGNVSAQEVPADPVDGNALQPYVVATVGISGQKIVSQSGNDIKFSFDISNRRNTQPGIKYAARLMEVNEGHGSVMDEKVYDEIISLNANEKKHKELSYSPPSFLKGNFQLAIIAFTDGGMELADEIIGEVVLDGSGEHLRIVPESCSLIVEGDNSNIYFIDQGVDIKPEETLIARCFVENTSKSNISASVHLATHYRTSLGQKITEEDRNKRSFTPESSSPILIKLPKATEPQAYDCVLSFRDAQGKTISNKIPFHYVLRGASATIQNLRLDKDNYLSGDAAVVLFDMTPSADSFEGSRFGGTYAGQMFLDISVNDNQGQQCSQIKDRAISDRDLDKSMSISMTMAKDCSLPRASIRVKDKDGRVLVSQNYFVGSDIDTEVIAQYDKEQKMSKESFFKKNRNMIILLVIALIPILILIFYLIRGKKPNFTIFILMAASGFFLLSGEAGAAEPVYLDGINETVVIPGSGWDGHYVRKAIYRIRLNKGNFQKGETLIALATTMKDASCANGVNMSGAYVTVDGLQKKIYYMGTPGHWENKTFDIEDCPYNDDFGVIKTKYQGWCLAPGSYDGADPVYVLCEKEGYYFNPDNKLDSYGRYKYKGNSNEWFRVYDNDGYSPISYYYTGSTGYRDTMHFLTEPFSETIGGVKYHGELNYTVNYIGSSSGGFNKCTVNYHGTIYPGDSQKFTVNSPIGKNYAMFDLYGAGGGFGHYFYMPYSVNVPSSDFKINLQINKTGEGNGNVSFSPANGARCSTSCTKTYGSGTSVTMTANPSGGSNISWGSGCDSKSGNSCRVNMNSDKDISVTFSKPTPPVPPPPESPSKEWKEVAP